MGKNPRFYISNYKTPTYLNQAVNIAKKSPPVGTYNSTDFKKKIKGCYVFNEGRSGYIEEAKFRGLQNCKFYDTIDLDKVRERVQFTKIFKSPPKYEEPKGTSLSALSYRHDESFDKT